MNNQHTHNQHSAQDPTIPADLAPIGAMLDRLGEVDRGAAPQGFEDRMASTTQFSLSASAQTSGRARSISSVGSRSTTRLAAALALAAAGVLIWSFRPHTTSLSPNGGSGPEIAKNDIKAPSTQQGDDSEVFSMVALALDGGASSDIDFLLKDTSELDGKIRGTTGSSLSSDETFDGSTM